MRQTALKLGGFVLLGIVVFAGALLLTFPSGLLARIVEAQAEKASDFAYDVEIRAAKLRGIGGLTLHDVSIVPTAPVEEGERRPRPLEIDRLRASVGLLSLPGAISGAAPPAARVVASVDEGRIRVTTRSGAEEWADIDVELFDVELAGFPMIRSMLGLGVRGQLAGTIALQYNEEQQLVGGEVNLGITRAMLEAGSIMQGKVDALPDGIPLPNTDIGTVRLDAQLDGATLRLGRLETSGSALRLEASGLVQMRQPLSLTTLSVPLEFQLDSAYVEEAGLGPVLGMFPQLQRAQVGDGYAMTLNGVVSSLRVQPGARRSP